MLQVVSDLAMLEEVTREGPPQVLYLIMPCLKHIVRQSKVALDLILIAYFLLCHIHSNPDSRQSQTITHPCETLEAHTLHWELLRF